MMIQHHRQSILVRGSSRWTGGIAREILPQGDILQQPLQAPFPSLPRLASRARLGLLQVYTPGVLDGQPHAPGACGRPGSPWGTPRPMAFSSSSCGEHLSGACPVKGIFAVVHHHHRRSTGPGHLLHGVGDQDNGGVLDLVIVPDVGQD